MEMELIRSITSLSCPERIRVLKEDMVSEPRYATIEQARIVTRSYQASEGKPRCIQRALALKAALEENGADFKYFEFPHSGHGLQNDNALSRQWMEAIEAYLDKYMEVSP